MILDLIAEAKADGLPVKRACKVLGLSPRTLQRWKAPVQPLPAPGTMPPAVTRPRPYNALTASEAAAVIALIRSPKHADDSCRDLALALQTGPTPTYVSHVTVWQYERALNCNGPRGRQVFQGRTAPDTDWVDGANQLWDWDITYLRTREPYVFLYLYSLLDHWSRKNIAWHVSARSISDEVQILWDHGSIDEGLLDQPAHTWPKSLSDRGSQMRSHSTTTYFRKLGIPQLLSRPRTPNDNPYIQTGELLPIEGYVLDQGSKPTHEGVILRLYERGIAPPDIARTTGHGLEAVDRYIKDYERVKVLLGKGLDVTEISHAIGRGQRTVRQYYKILLEFHPDLIPPVQEEDR